MTVRKVVLTGSESTGKTEIARALGRHYHAPVADEFVRGYAARLAQQGRAIDFVDHGPIAKGQMASEDAAIARATDLVILDTDLASTVAYCEHYFGRCPEWIVQAARERLADLYLLMKPDVPWVPDGVRDRGELREEMHAHFRGVLERIGARFTEIGGDWRGRLDAAIRAVDAL